MGEIVATAFKIAGGLGVVLLVVGLVFRIRPLAWLGGSLLLSAIGAWILGPYGVFLGLIVVPMGRIGRR